MKLKKLTLRKFKNFQDEEMEFAPITLLTGANSSGKTSVLQSLAAITQVRESGSAFPFDFQLNGPLARLGDFQNVINGHSAKGSFGLDLHFSDRNEVMEVGGTYGKADEGGGVVTRSVQIRDRRATTSISWNQKKQAYFLEYKPESSAPDSPIELFGGTIDLDWIIRASSGAEDSSSSKARTAETVLQDAAKSTNLDLKDFAQFFRQQEEEIQKGKIRLAATTFDDAMVEAKKLPPVSSAVNRMQNRVNRALRQISYVGAVRALPTRYYAASSSLSGFDPYGEAASLRLAKWKRSSRSRFSAVRDALIQLELATELTAETHLGEFVQVRVKPGDRKHFDTIADVGFGVSQVLPILVADAALPNESTLLVNQPEVHLHPSSQALLGNYFSQRISSKQYVIETHSEYLITRLRILVAKKILKPSDVAIYFMLPNPGSDGGLARRIRIDETGALIDAPKEFFRTYIADSYDLAMSSFSE